MQEEYTVLKRSRLLFAIILMALATPPAVLAQAQETQGQVQGTSAQTDGQPEAGQSSGASTTTTTTSRPVAGDTATTADEDVDGEDATELDAVDDAGAGERQAGLPHDLSPWGMFMAADIVVKGVMIGLAFASVVTWAVLLAKLVELAAAQRSASRAVRQLIVARGLEDGEQALGRNRGTVARMTRAAREEMEASEPVLDHVSDGGVKERISSRLTRMEVHAGRRIAKGTGLLATIGSTAPFVGLFGTVWGIMNSFIGISKAQTTNLAIVAPGIAEALLATAIGLVAAIPAVVIYNFLARAITGYRQNLADASAAIERLASRDLDMRRSLRHGTQRNERAAGSVVKIG
ncbi:tonB-system energizer ExbB [Shinella granuli]|uniref:Biopolymer transport protein ExbB n=1 Tax=Shinella granuli TaxID=323621 RepID=A0A4R2CKW2_SHIGR|nr:tonB-system energizer ExbB [Shinella granuli]TCN41476.1 outer membrane transport energization protein ExbB [Shinella granuli]